MLIIKMFMALVIVQVPNFVYAHKSNNERLDTIDARVQRIERVNTNQALVNMSQRIDALQREIQQLRGENEQLHHELSQLKARQREQFLQLDRRMQATSTNTTSNVISTDKPIPKDNATTGIISNADSQQIATTNGAVNSNVVANVAAQDYKNAFTLLKQGKYDNSIAAFNGFLQTHPGSKYVPNAQYWLAEANYVSKRYPQALTEFSKVIERYPASSKVADARLKLGFTYYELGQYDESRLELTKLRTQFPNSSVASLAQQRLERMAREGH